MNRQDPKFSNTFEAVFSHLKSLMEIYHWQNEQGRWFLKILITAGVRKPKALRTLKSLSGVRVTKTKQFGAFMTNRSPIVEELDSSSTCPGTSPIVFATSIFCDACN